MQESIQINLIIIIGSILFLLLSGFIIFSIVQFKRAQKIHDLEKSNLENEFSKELIQSELETKKSVLGLISDEIHDNIGQILSFVKLNVHSIKDENPGVETGSILENLDTAIHGLREISHTISNNELEEQNLESLIEKKIEELNQTGLLKSDLHCNADLESLSADRKLVLFRMIQEIMNNTVKHAEAREFKILVSESEGKIRVLCKDDGKGFDFSQKKNSNGLQNLRKRAESIGAKFKIKSSPGNGTETELLL